ncbi:MAG: quinone-dependent dihydroorotate dehydrogenase [Chloroflexi bacterium]|nr:quinone-dependent dihydroorotate dehydrogenase [Chloroflexota bacterium]
MFSFFRPLLFRLDPERAHALTLYALRVTQAFPPALWMLKQLYRTPPNPVQAFGLTFKNPIGLAAGYDKDALAVRGLAALGFSHVEVGTVTPLPQAGNPKPRVFRLLEEEAVINRMGFPSRGSEFAQKRLSPHLRDNLMERFIGFEARYQPKRSARMAVGDLILGVNLGKNKATPNESAVFDYLSLLQSFAPLADYLTINVSSPNTVGLRDLQGRAALEGLLAHLHAQRKLEETRLEKRLPLLVKLAPDLTPSELDDALDVIMSTGMDGIIATNTTLGREGVRSALAGESGGLSGGPLKGRSEAVLSQIVRRVNGRIPIVSAGGIMSPEDAQRRLDMGAALVQVYTGLIYRGPGLVKQIAGALSSSAAQASS